MFILARGVTLFICSGMALPAGTKHGIHEVHVLLTLGTDLDTLAVFVEDKRRLRQWVCYRYSLCIIHVQK